MSAFNARWIGVATLLAAVSVPNVWADQYSGIAQISGTLGNNAGRLCAGAAGNMQPNMLGCPTYAPSITTAGDVSVTGNLSATKFLGDGSGLTGLAGTSDRIISGTTSVTVNSATSTISFTTNGSVAGYIDNAGRHIMPGISVTTNQTSVTSLYASGNVGIGTTAPGAPLQISKLDDLNDQFRVGSNASQYISMRADHYGNAWIYSAGTQTFRMSAAPGGNVTLGDGTDVAGDNNGYFAILGNRQRIVNFGRPSNRPTLELYGKRGSGGVGVGDQTQISYRATASDNTTEIIQAEAGGVLENLGGSTTAGFYVSTRNAGTIAERLRVSGIGNVGIGTTAPNATLQVSGSQINTSWTAINLNRTAVTPLEVSGTISATAFVGDGSGLTNLSASADRIISGTTNVTVNSATSIISFTTAGVVAGYIDNQGRHIMPGISATTNQTSVTSLYASGNVGIGTTAPLSKLSVWGNGTSGNAIFVQNDKILGFGIQGTSTEGTAGFVKADASNNFKLWTTGYSYPIMLDASSIQLNANGSNGKVGIGTTSPTAALSVSGDLVVSSSFQTTSNPSLYVSGSTGKVGIGTNAPLSALYVAGTTGITNALGASYGLATIGTQGATGGSLFVNTPGLTTWGGGLGVDGAFTGGITSIVNIKAYGGAHPILNSVLTFSTQVTSSVAYSGPSERMRIDSLGNVGIGTTAPAKTLDVSGTANIASTTTIGGNTTVSGTVKLAGTGTEVCNPSSYYTMRINPATKVLEMCGP
jgi:hypothetical protein